MILNFIFGPIRCRANGKHNLSFGGQNGKSILAVLSSEGLSIYSLIGRERVIK